jgi:hypothetical protein
MTASYKKVAAVPGYLVRFSAAVLDFRRDHANTHGRLNVATSRKPTAAFPHSRASELTPNPGQKGMAREWSSYAQF